MNLLVISIHSDTAFTVICEKMTPYIAFSKSENQLTCMCSDMTRHHDQIADYGTEAAAFDIPFLTGSAPSDRFLSNHPEDIVGNHGEFQYQGIRVEFS